MMQKINPLSWPQYLLAKLGEECGELAQCSGKGLCFGVHDTNPNTQNPNWRDIQAEANDVNTLLWMVSRFGNVDVMGQWGAGAHNNQAMVLKQARVVFYAQWALHLGTLVLDNEEQSFFDQVLGEHAEYLSAYRLPGPIGKGDAHE